MFLNKGLEMKDLRQFFKKSFVRGSLFFLFLVIIGFAFNFFQNTFDNVLKPWLTPLGISWLLNIPLISVALFILGAILFGSLLAISSVRAFIKNFPLVSIPIKFSESVENLSGFPAVMVATVPGVYNVGFVTGTPRKNGIPHVSVFIPDLPSFIGGRILLFSLNGVELIIEPRNLGEMISVLMNSTAHETGGLDENTKSEFKTKPLKGMSYKELTAVLRNVRRIELEELK